MVNGKLAALADKCGLYLGESLGTLRGGQGSTAWQQVWMHVNFYFFINIQVGQYRLWVSGQKSTDKKRKKYVNRWSKKLIYKKTFCAVPKHLRLWGLICS